MSQGYGAVREYHDDPSSQQYRDNPFSEPRRGYQSQASGSSSLQELCSQIGNNIFQINNGANTIERALKSIGTERDTPLIRDKIHETSTNTNKVVQTTTRLIRSANGLKGNRQQKMQIDRLTSDFQESISRFQTLQKKAMEKVKSSVRLGSQSKSKGPQPLVDVSGFGDIDFHVLIWQEADDRQRLMEEDRVAQLQSQEVVIEDDLALLREREERIHQLESDILDVNEIFRDLGAMISEQGEMLNDIESNVERAYSNVESGNEQLVKAAEYQQGNRTSHKHKTCRPDPPKRIESQDSGYWENVSLLNGADHVDRSEEREVCGMRKSRKKKCCLLVLFLVIAIVVTIIIVVAVKTS